jgi:predicted permease
VNVKLHLWLIQFIGVLVPRRLRADWRQEWEAELQHRELLLANWDKLNLKSKLDLSRRSLGAFWDALLLQPARLEDEVFQDLRYGARMLLKKPGFTAVAVLTMALGIGANTAIFSVIDAAMLRVLPVDRPEQLVLFSRLNPQGGGESFTHPQFEEFRDRNQVFANVFGFAYRQPKVTIDGREEEAVVQLASGQYFSALGVRATLGRTWTPSSDRISGAAGGADQIAVISDSFWRKEFARDPAVLGKSVTINGGVFEIIGVAPADFTGVSLDYAVDVWLPLPAQPLLDGQSKLNEAGGNWIRVMARQKPEVSLAQATAGSDLIFHQYLLSVNAPPEALAQRVGLAPGARPISGIRQSVSQPLLMLMVIVLLVLLIACANLANMLLARATARQREITVRLALGASRLRIVRQLLTESILLALLGGAAGILIGKWGSDLLMTLTFKGLARGPLPVPLTFQLDLRILGFTVLISFAAGILFGLAPALRATRTDLVSGLKESTSHVSGPRRRRTLNQFLVAAQVAASLVLLIAAGLFVRSFQKLATVELGFNPQVVQMRVTPPANYTDAQRDGVWNALEEKLSSYPGVIASSSSLPGLFSHNNYYTVVSVEGTPPRRPSGERDHDVAFFVRPGFFSTMGMPLLMGRDFGEQDQQNSANVAIINETMARRLFPNRNPMAQRVSLGGNVFLEIVGVVKDAKYDSVLSAVPAMIYTPLAQLPFPAQTRFFAVRTADTGGISTRLLEVAQNIGPDLLVESRQLIELVDESLMLQHLIARLTGLFGGLGLLLSCVGVYGIMSFTVTQRSNEMGIRLALGAQRADIIRLVLREAMLPVLGGSAIGLAVALSTTSLVASQLFDLASTDPVTISMAVLVMVAVALLAAYVPAHRASRVEPMVALRYE